MLLRRPLTCICIFLSLFFAYQSGYSDIRQTELQLLIAVVVTLVLHDFQLSRYGVRPPRVGTRDGDEYIYWTAENGDDGAERYWSASLEKRRQAAEKMRLRSGQWSIRIGARKYWFTFRDLLRPSFLSHLSFMLVKHATPVAVANVGFFCLSLAVTQGISAYLDGRPILSLPAALFVALACAATRIRLYDEGYDGFGLPNIEFHARKRAKAGTQAEGIHP
jgi:hypothetical protein